MTSTRDYNPQQDRILTAAVLGFDGAGKTWLCNALGRSAPELDVPELETADASGATSPTWNGTTAPFAPSHSAMIRAMPDGGPWALPLTVVAPLPPPPPLTNHRTAPGVPGGVVDDAYAGLPHRVEDDMTDVTAALSKAAAAAVAAAAANTSNGDTSGSAAAGGRNVSGHKHSSSTPRGQQHHGAQQQLYPSHRASNPSTTTGGRSHGPSGGASLQYPHTAAPQKYRWVLLDVPGATPFRALWPVLAALPPSYVRCRTASSRSLAAVSSSTESTTTTTVLRFAEAAVYLGPTTGAAAPQPTAAISRIGDAWITLTDEFVRRSLDAARDAQALLPPLPIPASVAGVDMREPPCCDAVVYCIAMNDPFRAAATWAEVARLAEGAQAIQRPLLVVFIGDGGTGPAEKGVPAPVGAARIRDVEAFLAAVRRPHVSPVPWARPPHGQRSPGLRVGEVWFLQCPNEGGVGAVREWLHDAVPNFIA